MTVTYVCPNCEATKEFNGVVRGKVLCNFCEGVSLFPLDPRTAEYYQNKIDNAAQAAAETHDSWEHRCYAILSALGLNFGEPTPDIPEQNSYYARKLQYLEDKNLELIIIVNDLTKQLKGKEMEINTEKTEFTWTPTTFVEVMREQLENMSDDGVKWLTFNKQQLQWITDAVETAQLRDS